MSNRNESLDPDLWSDLLGVPFAWGGRNAVSEGLDCLGLAAAVYGRMGVRLPDPKSGLDRMRAGEPVIEDGLRAAGFRRVDRPVVGALVCMEFHGLGTLDHIGILVTTDRVLHTTDGIAGAHVTRLHALREMAQGTVEIWAPDVPLPAPAQGESAPLALVAASALPLSGRSGGSPTTRQPDAQPNNPTKLSGVVHLVLIPDPLRDPQRRATMRVPVAAGTTVGDLVPMGWQRDGMTVLARDGSGEDLDMGAPAPDGGSLVLMRAPAGLSPFVVSLIVGLALSAASFLLQLVLAPDLDKPREEDDTGSPTFRLSGLRNTALTGVPIGVVYGEHRVGGNIISVFFTADAEGRQILNMLLCVSHGPIESIGGLTGERNDLIGASIPQDIKINGTWAGEFRNVRCSTRTGTANQTPIPGFQNVVTAVPYEITLVPGAPFTHTTTDDVEEVQVLISFPAGLFRLSGSGNTSSRTVTIQVRYRVHGTTTWTTIQEVITAGQRAPFTRQITITGLALETYEVEIERISPVFPNAEPEKVDQSDLVSINEVTYDSLAFPGCALLGIRAMSDEQLPGGSPPTITSVIKGRRVWVPFSSAVGGFLEMWSDNPAWVVMDMLLHPMYGGFRNAGLTMDDIDIPAFQEWADHCNTMVADGRGGYITRAAFDGVFDGSANLWESAVSVARSHWADLTFVGNKVSVVVRKSSDPVAVFGMSQVRDFALKYTGGRSRPNLVKAGYANKEIDYERDSAELTSSPDLFVSGLPVVERELSLVGVTRPSQAYRNVKFELNWSTLLDKTVVFTVGPEGIHLLPGDVVQLSHDAVAWGVSGRLTAATATSFAIDKECTLGPTSRVVVRTDGTGEDVLQVRTLGPGTPTTYPAGTNFTVAAWDVGDVPEVGDPYSIGDASTYVKSFRIVDIRTNPDLSREISAVLYDADVFDDDPGPVEQFTDVYPDRETMPPSIENLLIFERAVLGTRDGFGLIAVDISWRRPALAAGADVYFRVRDPDNEADAGNQSWRYLTRSMGNDAYAVGFTAGETVEFSVVPVSAYGTRGAPERGSKANITLRGKAPLPSAPPSSGFRAERHREQIVISTPSHPDASVDGYIVTIGATAGRAGRRCIASVDAGKATMLPLFVAGTSATITFFAKNRNGCVSPEGESITLAVGTPDTLSVVLERDERANAWPGSTTNIASSGTGITNSTATDDGVYTTAGHAPTGSPVEGLVVIESETDLVEYELTWDDCVFHWASRGHAASTWADSHSNGHEIDDMVSWAEAGVEWASKISSVATWDGFDLMGALEPTVEVRIHDGSSWGDWGEAVPFSADAISQVAARVTLPGVARPWQVLLHDLVIRAYQSSTSGIGSLVPKWTMVSVTADETVSAFQFVNVTAGSSGLTMTLDPGADGDEVIIKRVDKSTGSVTVSADAADTIDGSSSVLLTEEGDAIHLVFDDSASMWRVA